MNYLFVIALVSKFCMDYCSDVCELKSRCVQLFIFLKGLFLTLFPLFVFLLNSTSLIPFLFVQLTLLMLLLFKILEKLWMLLLLILPLLLLPMLYFSSFSWPLLWLLLRFINIVGFAFILRFVLKLDANDSWPWVRGIIYMELLL